MTAKFGNIGSVCAHKTWDTTLSKVVSLFLSCQQGRTEREVTAGGAEKKGEEEELRRK